jgi:hypothetical protein
MVVATELTRERLEPLMRRIAETLGSDSKELVKFEKWALGLMQALLAAGTESRAALVQQVQLTRAELLELQHDISVGIAATGRTELLRVCRREWLMSLVDFVDELFDVPDVTARLVA